MAAEAAAPELEAGAKGAPPAAPAGTASGAASSAPASKGGKDAKAGKDAKKAKKPKKGAAEADTPDGQDGAPSIAAHPRAVRAVARWKSWGGLIGFALTGYLSLSTSTLAEAMLRALIAGVVCYVAVWAAAVFVWRRLVMLELKGREAQLYAAAEERSPRRELPAGAPERPRARPGRSAG